MRHGSIQAAPASDGGRTKSLRVGTLQLLYTILFCLCVPALADTHAVKTHIETVPATVAHPEPVAKQIIRAGSKAQLQGEVQQNQQLDKLNQRLGFSSKSQGKNMFPAKVTAVTAGSPIAKRGIASGDSLLGEVTNSDGSVTLTMEHCGQDMRFTIKAKELTTGLTQTAATTQATAVTQTATIPLNTKTNNLTTGITGNNKKQLKSIVDVLENHDLGLLIDCSGSMDERDCPGGLTRWDWCCREATGLAQAAAQASSSIDASLFNSQYRTFRHISPMQIPEIFAENKPQGGTEPAYALQEQLENYFNSPRAKPLTIVVVTDGMPGNPSNLAAVLQEESQKIRYQGEVTITFLLIGTDQDDETMRAMIGLAPGSSVHNGGFVDILPFNWTAGKGIKEALFAELKQVRMDTDPRKRSTASQTATGMPGGRMRQNPSLSVGHYGNRGNSNTGYGGIYSGNDSKGVVREITTH
jgi:hypothetical protein